MNNPSHTNLTVTSDRRIPIVLLLLRLSIFIVMFRWTLDKFVRPDHAAPCAKRLFSWLYER